MVVPVLDTANITSVASAGRQDLTLTTPIGGAEGDLLIFVHARSGGVGWGTVSPSLTAGAVAQTGDTSGNLLIRPYTRTVDGGENGSYTWDANLTGYRSGLGMTFSGSSLVKETRTMASTRNGVGTGQSAAVGSAWSAHSGDHGLLVVAATWNADLTTPTGWQQVLKVEQASSGTGSHDLYVFTRNYTATGTDQPAVVNNGFAASVVGLGWLLDGVPPSNPFVGHWRYRFDSIS